MNYKSIQEMTVFDGGTSDNSEGQEGSIPSMLLNTLTNYVSNVEFKALSIDNAFIVTGSVIINGKEYLSSFRTNKIDENTPKWIAAFIFRDIIRQAFGFNI